LPSKVFEKAAFEIKKKQINAICSLKFFIIVTTGKMNFWLVIFWFSVSIKLRISRQIYVKKRNSPIIIAFYR
jgi:hypothetical protein